MAETDQVAGQLVQRLVIVGADAGPVRGRVVDERVHIGDAVLVEQLRKVAVMRLADQQQRVDAALDQLAHLPVLLLGIVFRAGEQQRVAGLRQFALQRLDGAREVAMRQSGKHCADRPGPARRERARRAMRHPAEMAHHRGDAVAQLLGHGGRIVHGARDRRGRDARDPCDVAQSDVAPVILHARPLRPFRHMAVVYAAAALEESLLAQRMMCSATAFSSPF
jgi:hypothetical protein